VLLYTINNRSTELELLYIDDLVEAMFDLLEGQEQHCEYPKSGEMGLEAYLKNYHQVKGKVDETMGGKVLEYEAKTILNQGSFHLLDYRKVIEGDSFNMENTSLIKKSSINLQNQLDKNSSYMSN
jgi:hypothetical protein